MAPWLPRVHFFEIDDQSWFPSFLRVHVQNALTVAWRGKTPLQKAAPAHVAADVLIQEMGDTLASYTFIDFCAGGGGPTPSIERVVNAHLRSQGETPVDFVLTDLHPNVEAWDRIARKNPRITYESASVDATAAPAHVVQRVDGKKTMRLFNLAFHHFDDELALEVLRNTVQNSDGFVIFEMQGRNLVGMLMPFALGVGYLFAAPMLAWKARSLSPILFTYIIPILPFVLIFDGIVSALRMRSPGEVQALLDRSGSNANSFEMHSGTVVDPWIGCLKWIMCMPKHKA